MSKRLLLTFEKMENKPLEISRDITINLKKKARQSLYTEKYVEFKNLDRWRCR